MLLAGCTRLHQPLPIPLFLMVFFISFDLHPLFEEHSWGIMQGLYVVSSILLCILGSLLLILPALILPVW